MLFDDETMNPGEDTGMPAEPVVPAEGPAGDEGDMGGDDTTPTEGGM